MPARVLRLVLANQLFGRSGEVWRCIQQCRFAVREGKRAAEAGGGLTKDVLDSLQLSEGSSGPPSVASE